MRILFNDILQYSDAPEKLISPALADKWIGTSATITLDKERSINCIGIGFTDATEIVINGETIIISAEPDQNGLYFFDDLTAVTDITELIISHNGSYIGRLAAGTFSELCTSVTKEFGFYKTGVSAVTTGGQIIPGKGGISGRVFNVDLRYKIQEKDLREIIEAMPSQISESFPFFVYFDSEADHFLTDRFYAEIPETFVFQTSIRAVRYSIRLSLVERY